MQPRPRAFYRQHRYPKLEVTQGSRSSEQGTCLEVIDGPQAPALREEDTTDMPGGLTRYPSEHLGELTRRR